MLCDLKSRYFQVRLERKERRRKAREKWWCEFKCWWHCRHDYILVLSDRFYECSICGKDYTMHLPYPSPPPFTIDE